MKEKTDHYNKLGVSSDKGALHNAIKNLPKGLYPNGFCKILPDEDPDYCIIMHADGAGTKSSLIYLMWCITRDLKYFRNIPIDAQVMNTDDLICVGALGPFEQSQIISRNRFLITDESKIIDAIIQGSQDFIDKMNDYGIVIYNMGGETEDVGDLVRTIAVNTTMRTRMRRSDVIECNMLPGDYIVGLASYGQATYEAEYNSGIGSNGLTAARHDLFLHEYAERFPELYDPNMPKELVYRGTNRLISDVKDPTKNVGELIASPTRTYAPVIKDLLAHTDRKNIGAIIHCSGGGQTKCLNFANSLHIIKDNLFELPPVFKIIHEGGMEMKQMYQTFNMGHRMEVYCHNDTAVQQTITSAAKFNIEAKVIGHCKEYDSKKLTIMSSLGTFEWEK